MSTDKDELIRSSINARECYRLLGTVICLLENMWRLLKTFFCVVVDGFCAILTRNQKIMKMKPVSVFVSKVWLGYLELPYLYVFCILEIKWRTLNHMFLCVHFTAFPSCTTLICTLLLIYDVWFVAYPCSARGASTNTNFEKFQRQV